MPDRKPMSPSLRWSVFARDGFSCRYCGAQAGQDGVDLVVDHARSVAEGGDNAIDNLVTACRACNGGKGARSLANAPAPGEVVARVRAREARLQDLADAMEAARAAAKRAEQEAINLKCAAYGQPSVGMAPGEEASIIRLCAEHGADCVLDWYTVACAHDVPAGRAIKYVHGIIRNLRGRGDLGRQPADAADQLQAACAALVAHPVVVAFKKSWRDEFGREYEDTHSVSSTDLETLASWIEGVDADAEVMAGISRYLNDPWWRQRECPLWGFGIDYFAFVMEPEMPQLSGGTNA